VWVIGVAKRRQPEAQAMPAGWPGRRVLEISSARRRHEISFNSGEGSAHDPHAQALINAGGLIWNSGNQEKPPGVADFIGSPRSFFPSS
jgi:hypothetical protein